MEIEEFKKLLFGFQQSQNHQQYEKYYKELTEAFKKLKTENEELREGEKGSLYYIVEMYKLQEEITQLKEKLKEYQKQELQDRLSKGA
jgi:DNA repair exonuclease SbcCD ATPase subunit